MFQITLCTSFYVANLKFFKFFFFGEIINIIKTVEILLLVLSAKVNSKILRRFLDQKLLYPPLIQKE